MGIRISPQRMRNSMLVIAVWLTACALAQNAYYELRDEPIQAGFLFDTRTAATPIDWYSALALFLCAVLIGIIASVAKRRGLPHPIGWMLLAALFVLLSLDEAAEIHERANAILVKEWDTSGVFKNAWILPAAILLPLIGLAFVPFVRDLPGRVRRLMIAAGAVYVAGALLLEVIEGLLLEAEEEKGGVFGGFGQASLEGAQNLLEMVGIAILAYALLLFLERLRPPVRLGFGE